MRDAKDDSGMIKAPVDNQIVYPSYKSFDEFIDIARLSSLNDYLTEKINARIKTQKDSYFLNLHRLDSAAPYIPGVREIWLTETKSGVPYDYLDLNKSELWQPTPAATEFSLLMDFIKTLPFQMTGRILIIYDDSGASVPAHRDHLNIEICHEFIWFRTNLKKPFYMLNNLTDEKSYVQSYSAWFDSVNQFHGSDAVDELSFSLRVDGVFDANFRKQIPLPSYNFASTPSLWACSGNA